MKIDLKVQELKTFGVKNMMQIFGLSRVSIYRRSREAREGRGGFPLPIQTGAKRGLRWNVDTVREFIENMNSVPTMPLPHFESATKQAARHRVAMKELEKLGVKIPQKGQE